MKLTVLGYSGAYPTSESGTTAYLLESNGFHLAIDMGSGGFMALKQVLDPLQLDALIISHYHGDHIADVNVLQYYRQLNQKEGQIPLKIYANDEDLCHFQQFSIPNVSEAISYHEDDEIMVGPFKITFLRTIHPVSTFAMRIEEKATGKSLVFTADTGYMENMITFAHDCDLFLADTYFLSGNEHNAFHLTAKETGEIGYEAHVHHIVATHLSDKVNLERLRIEIEAASQYQIPVDIAHQGQIFMI